MFTVVGSVVSAPLGLAFGRIVLRYVADYTPVAYVPPLALLALVAAGPVALMVACTLAAWPSRRAASMNLADVEDRVRTDGCGQAAITAWVR